MDFWSLCLGLVVGFLVGFLLMKIRSFQRERQIRKETIRWAKNAVYGEVYEKILPTLPNFPYAPKDMVFIGKGCDYIIFDGLSQWVLREILFLEVKSGKSRLNRNEQTIRRAVEGKSIRYAEYRIDAVKTEKNL